MEYTNAVRRHLEAFPGVENVALDVFSGCSAQQLREWEVANRPFKLPEDLRAFLEVTNGLSLHWDVRVAGRTQPFGRINVNNVDAIIRIPLESVFADDDVEEVDSLFEHGGARGTAACCVAEPLPAGVCVKAAFDLDKMCGCGVVALVYLDSVAPHANHGIPPPRVYFQDLSCRWRLLASSFSEYLRLLTMHLGLPNWQYAFTPFGLDEASRQWFNLLSPDRLAMDVHAGRLRAVGDADGPDKVAGRSSGPHHKGYIGRSSARRNRERATMRIAAGDPKLQQPDRREIDRCTRDGGGGGGGISRPAGAAATAAHTAAGAAPSVSSSRATAGAYHQKPFR